MARFLDGQALDVYQRMSDDDVGEYELLKNSLLKRFRLTERGYRKKFESERIEVGETAEQFVDGLKKYLTKWREMAGFEATYQTLQNMVLRDQFFITCDKSLQIFLRKKEKLSLKEWSQSMNGHRAENYRKRETGYRPRRSDIICFKCGIQGHKQFWCPNINEKRLQKIAAMQVINQSSFRSDPSK